MALTTCNECHATLSSAANACPHCGAANPNDHIAPALKAMFWVAGIVALGVVVFVVSALASGAHLESAKKAAVRADLASIGRTMTSYDVFAYHTSPVDGAYFTCGSADWKNAAGQAGSTDFIIAQDAKGGTIVAHSIDSTNAVLARRYNTLYTLGCMELGRPS